MPLYDRQYAQYASQNPQDAPKTPDIVAPPDDPFASPVANPAPAAGSNPAPRASDPFVSAQVALAQAGLRRQPRVRAPRRPGTPFSLSRYLGGI